MKLRTLFFKIVFKMSRNYVCTIVLELIWLILREKKRKKIEKNRCMRRDLYLLHMQGGAASLPSTVRHDIDNHMHEEKCIAAACCACMC